MKRSGWWATRRRGWGAGLLALVLVGGVVSTAAVASTELTGVGADAAQAVAITGIASSTPPLHSGTAGDAPIGPGTASPPVEPGSAEPTASAAPVGWLHTDGSTIVTADGEPYVIKAVAWFGMETSNCAPHGLWTISLDAGLAQIASMGFNTIRLPFSNECLAAQATSSINAYANPGLASLTPLQLMDAVIAAAKSYGLSVILDRHRPDSGAQSALWYTDRYPESAWIADWTMLAQRYAEEPAVIGVDLHNEPHGEACWGCGDPAVDWRAAAKRAGDAVLAVNPHVLIVVEGVEKQSDSDYTWWGGGLAGAGSQPVSLDVPDRVVYSPHDYPASVYPQSWFAAADYPANLPAVWDANWGYLQKEGIAPVLLGEFGTTLQSPSDAAWLTALVSYLQANGMSFAYWSFNPNSGDTGGLVQDDWMTPQAAKLAALAPLIGEGSVVPPHAGVPTVAPTPAVPAPASPPSSPGSPTSPLPTSPIPGTAHPGTPGPSAPGESGAGAAPGLTDLAATWTLQSEWEAGYVTELTVSNSGATSGWTVTWPDPGASSVVNAWGMECGVAAATVTCTGAQWGALVGPGQSVTVGVQIASSSAPNAPPFSITAR